MKHATIEDAPAVLNTNDKAMWVLGFNDGQEATIKQLAAGVSVEPVAWRNPVDSYSLVTTHQKETNEFQYSDEFLAGHTEPLYTADAIAAARVQTIEECIEATRGVLRDTASHLSYQGCGEVQIAIRALLGKDARNERTN